MHKIERVPTGIPGLDDILHGGFIKGSNILISGPAGTGKTIFCLQFLYNGIVKYNQPGILLTLEERPSELRREASLFGWDLSKLESEGLLVIIDGASSKAGLPTYESIALKPTFSVETIADKIYKAKKEINAERIVIDSISGLSFQLNALNEIRDAIFKLSSLLRELNLTSLMTTEVVDESRYSRYGVEEFITQGLILLSLREIDGELRRSLIVRKMRGTSHSLKRFTVEISNSGFVVMPTGEL